MDRAATTQPNGNPASPIQNFRDLRVWQEAMDLAVRVYDLTRSFPRHELYGLASQMQRAAVSVAANIAEGHTRHHLGDYLHHVSIARASLAELETHLELTKRLAYAPEPAVSDLIECCGLLGRRLNALRKSLEAKRP
jgi:four helix bundle protein